MKPKVSVFIATSLDGFIARNDGDLDWLVAAQATVSDGEDCGYTEFMESIDTLVMGRHTYEKVLSFGKWTYGETRVIVLSSNPVSVPDALRDRVTSSSDDPVTLYDRLARDGVGHVYVDGGNTIQRFLSAGLIDEMTITVIPVLLGAGIRLFGSLGDDVALSCVSTKRYDFGFAQLKYAVLKGD